MENESFIRWQGRAIEEFGKTINLILAISLATIGFVINKLLESGFSFENCFAKVFIFIGTITILIAIVIILFLIRMRLLNFRDTAKISRKREKNRIDNIEDLRKKSKKTGFCVWNLLNVSIWLFGIGEGFTIVGFLIHLSSKL